MNSRLCSQIRWKKASLWSLLITALLFFVLNRHGCRFFSQEPWDFVRFIYVFLWLVAFFALAAIWRTVLLIGTLIFLVPLVGLRGVAESNAAPESAAVHALHDMHTNLQRLTVEQKQEAYPDILPTLTLSHVAQKFYRFEYIPKRSADGMIHSYFIEAIPAHRACGLERSFTITSDNKVFWTFEPRAATTSDNFLAE